jgi:hypothetical protein
MLSFEEIEDTTPNELDALIDQYLIHQDLENERFGQVCATISNWKRDPESKPEPFVPTDFFLKLSQPDEEENELDEKQQAMMLNAFFEDVSLRTKLRRNKVII